MEQEELFEEVNPEKDRSTLSSLSINSFEFVFAIDFEQDEANEEYLSMEHFKKKSTNRKGGLCSHNKCNGVTIPSSFDTSITSMFFSHKKRIILA